MDAQRLGQVDEQIELARDHVGVGLGLDKSEATELRAGAGDGVADDIARRDGEAGLAVDGGLLEERRDLLVGHVGQDGILLDGEANLQHTRSRNTS